jgi:hypothetical protein
MQPTPQDDQLMSKHRVLGFKPQLRLKWRGQDGENEIEQPDHSANLGDSITASTRIMFSVHTGVLDGLFRAATKHSVHLTPHEVVIARATKAAARLDASLRAAATGGRLKEFHAEYRRRRVEASANGKPFMSFTMAERRFRRAIVARLLSDGVAADLFDKVFDT